MKVLFVAIAVVVAGCGANPFHLAASSERQVLAGHTFASVSVVFRGHDRPLVQGLSFHGPPHVEIRFGWDWIQANSGCNYYNVQGWEVSGGRIQTGADWDGTIMGCSQEQEAQDAWLMNFISSGPTLSSGNGTLVLTSGPTVVTLVEAANPAPTHDARPFAQ